MRTSRILFCNINFGILCGLKHLSEFLRSPHVINNDSFFVAIWTNAIDSIFYRFVYRDSVFLVHSVRTNLFVAVGTFHYFHHLLLFVRLRFRWQYAICRQTISLKLVFVKTRLLLNAIGHNFPPNKVL